MSEPQGEPQAADVRSFLPWPGEPVEEYAARLRALHHDLTLVLDAVERGLAAAERVPAPVPVAVPEPEPEPEPEPVGAFAEPRPGLHRSPPPSPFGTPAPVGRGGARVEVVTTGRDEPSSGPPQERASSAGGGGRRDPMGETAQERELPEHQPPDPAWADPGPWDAPRWQQTPPPWTERRPSAWPPPPPPPREMAFDPPYLPRAHRRAPAISPLLIAATVLGWLTVLALILALALD